MQVDEWFEQALARDHDARFENAREMAASFERTVAVFNVRATGILPRFDTKALRRRESSRYAIVIPREEPDEKAHKK